MPESQEVKLIADSVSRVFLNKVLVGYGFDDNSKFHKFPIDNIHLIVNLVMSKVDTHGKKILFHLADTSNKVRLIIVTSLGMEGKYLYRAGKHSNFWFSFHTGYSGKFRVLEELFFDDSRHFGLIEVHTPESLEIRMKSVGPDFATGKVTRDDFKKKITSRLRDKSIYSFLMNQKYFSGLGNYLTAESLYESKLSPLRSLSSLTDTHIDTLLESIQLCLKISRESGGLTIHSFYTADGKTGHYPCKVYGKNKDPLNNSIEKITIGTRTCHYCPKIQL